MLTTVAIQNYRSLQDIALEFGQITAITGPNGSGKSNIYKALSLAQEIMREGALTSLAREGGLRNVLFAGKRTAERVALRLGIAVDDLRYAIDLGLPQLGPFPLDPEVKSERVWHGVKPRPSAILAERIGQHVSIVDESFARAQVAWNPRPEESMLATLTDPQVTPELYSLRETARGWRFYDNLRVDAASPARLPGPETFTPILAADGSNVASALATVLRIGDSDALSHAIDAAFPGARLSVNSDNTRGIAHLEFDCGLKRPLTATELSDGTLRYVMLAVLLHSPRPAPLLVLNEPEGSLHGSLLQPLAKMIIHASRATQIIVVSHSRELVDALSDHARVIELNGSLPTTLESQSLLDSPRWEWPAARR